MLEANDASMIKQNNDTIAANEIRNNQEQRNNRNSRWTGIEKKIIALTCFSYWPLIGILMFVYIKFYAPVEPEIHDFGSDFQLLRPSEESQNVEDSWRTALRDYANRHTNKTAAFVDGNEIKCPKMYTPVSYTHLTLPTNREV